MSLRANINSAVEQAKQSGLTKEDLDKCLDRLSKELTAVPLTSGSRRSIFQRLHPYTIVWFSLYRLLPLGLLLVVLYRGFRTLYSSEPCFIAQPIMSEFAMPVVNCTKCQGITHVPKVANISVQKFMNEYAFKMQPVLIKGAASDWPAMNLFSYKYFKQLYSEKPESMDFDEEDGQFFAYSSGINSLNEFMALSDEAAAMKKKKWYIGWSTSDPYIGKELRKHVKEPYFLPKRYSDETIAWIFMGAPGPGANLHVDMVGRPSWQAQLSGKKTWILIPPPECEQYCSNLNVTVHKGDIVVLDTNVWFHATYIHPGEISITYGTEYE